MGLLFVFLGAACSSGGGRTEGAGTTADVAGQLATRADRVAAALSAGACDEGRAEALSLQSDVAALPWAPAVKAEAAAGAERLVAAITCVPPTTMATTPPPEPRPKKGKKHKGDDDDD